MFDVFLSHNSKDKRAVRRLADALRKRQVSVWLDVEQLEPGGDWQKGLEDGLKGSKTVAVLVGKDGLGPWQAEEVKAVLQLAVRHKKKLIPVLLPKACKKPRLPLFITNRTWLDLRRGIRKEGIDKLIWGITGRKPYSGKQGERRQSGATTEEKQSKRRSRKVLLSATRLRHGAEHLVGREKELGNLDRAWDDPKTHVVTIVAWGGMGKTALVVDWMARMARDGWRGAERVFDWSFYSQGTSDTTSASSDQFVAKALEFFGDPETAASAASPWDKGERLAHLVAERKTLLVLDGVEPLQYPPGPVGGKLKDPALEALLKGLAQNNPGLCILTTRESVTDLKPFRDTTAPEWLLEHLSEEAGAQLLCQAGVKRAGNAEIGSDDSELKDAAREVGGHALTLRLLGNYLKLAHAGDVRKRDMVRLQEADHEFKTSADDADKPYGHAFKVMATCQRWLAGAGEQGKRQLAVLHLLGLFDRPADGGCLDALRKEPAIDGLTEPLVGLTDAQWNTTLSRLEDCGIVTVHTDESATGNTQPTIDAHPLVREYFGTQLRDNRRKTWQAAHRRLYEHLREAAPDLPDDYPTMVPLFQAFVHGCLAGEHSECFDEIYRRRIERGNHHYLTNGLGATSTEIHLLGFLFEPRWEQTVDAITEERQVYAFRQIGLAFRALGDLDAGVLPLTKAVELSQRIDDRGSEINSCRHLAQTLAAAGRLAEARTRAKQAVDRIDSRVSQFDTVAAWAGLGHILHQLGEIPEATDYFRQAEQRLNQRGCKDKHLSSLQGFRYCELLAEQGKYHEVLNRSEVVTHREDRASFRAARGLGLVMRAKALYLTCVNRKDLRAQLHEISHTLGEGLKTLCNAGHREFYVFGLLCRAAFRERQGNAAGARADLADAWQIAKRGSMRLHMADVLLHRGRLFRDKAALAEARKLIDECGYHRRDGELADAEEAAKGW